MGSSGFRRRRGGTDLEYAARGQEQAQETPILKFFEHEQRLAVLLN